MLARLWLRVRNWYIDKRVTAQWKEWDREEAAEQQRTTGETGTGH